MGNVLTVEAAAPFVFAVIAIAVALQWRKRETGTSQDNTAAGKASITSSQSTYRGLNQPVINNYYGIPPLLQGNYNRGIPTQSPDSTSELPSDMRGTTSESPPSETDLRLPPQVQEGQQIPAPTPSVVKGVYWFSYSGMGAADIDATLYTHIFCAFAELDHNTNKVTISNDISSFASTFQRSNPSVSTILSIKEGNYSTMASSYTSRQSFINSAIQLARNNNFCGLDINWQYPEGTVGMGNYDTLLTELRTAVNAEAITSGRAPLLFTAVLYFSAIRERDTFPVESIKRNLNWINLMTYDYHGPSWEPRFTAAPAALYDQKSKYNTKSGIDCWIRMGLPPSKIALGLPSYGRAWKVVNSNINGLGVGVAANGPAVGNEIKANGAIAYIDIKKFIKRNKASKYFDSSVVSNSCYDGTTWIGYDDVESVTAKVLFAKDRGLLGYIFWSVCEDEKFVLCRTAYNAYG